MPKVIFTDHKIKSFVAEKGGQVTYFEKQRMRHGHSNRGLSLALSVSYGGSKSWYAITYVAGKPKWTKLGKYPALTLAQARDAAWSYFENPTEFQEQADVGTFREVAEQWFQRHVVKNQLRSKSEIRRQLEKYVYPTWGSKKFTSIRRPEVAALLDQIEDNNGTGQAGMVFAMIRGIMSWYEGRSESYRTPVVKAMSARFKSNPRSRVLTDEELVVLWSVTEDSRFGSFVRLCLLTAQRQTKVTFIKYDDISADGVWTIATEAREKGNAEKLKLPEMALSIINNLPRLANNPYIFWGRGTKPFNNHAAGKAELDAAMLRLVPDMTPWVIHDLRRTARSLLSRAGIRPDISEKVLGHKLSGVEAVYDRHKFEAEKSDALAKLANLIGNILDPNSKVIQFHQR